MKRFNNIVASQEDYNQLKSYLDNNQVPANIKSKSRFKTKYEGFIKQNDKIIYEPLGLEVIEPDNKQEKLEEIYKNDKNSLGKGAYSLYKYIQSRYIGLTRKEVQEFITFQSDYQMGQQIQHRVNKPIVSKYPNQLWAIDLIDLDAYKKTNKQYRYIMNVVDIFSRKIWLAKLKTKAGWETRNAFQSICERAGVTPNSLISDNGKEWLGLFKTFCEDNEIQQRFTRSYSPQANGIVERANKDIRKILRAFMVQNEKVLWTNLLNTIEENKNEGYHSSIKGIPNQVWTPTKEKLTLRDLPETIVRDNPKLMARVSIVKKTLRQIRKFREQDDFEEGDLVRVKMSSIFANVRRLVKGNESKKLVVTYTPDTFRIYRVIVPHGILERKRYMLENGDGEPIRTKKNNAVQFHGSELLLWDGENDVDITMEKALRLNGVETNQNDFLY